jgi:hypothetical protein
MTRRESLKGLMATPEVMQLGEILDTDGEPEKVETLRKAFDFMKSGTDEGNKKAQALMEIYQQIPLNTTESA